MRLKQRRSRMVENSKYGNGEHSISVHMGSEWLWGVDAWRPVPGGPAVGSGLR
jgi:hypothetical protein